jgi:hypothetical protein
MASALEILLGSREMDFGLQQAYLKVACRFTTQAEVGAYVDRLRSDPDCPVLEAFLKCRASRSQVESLWQHWSKASSLEAVHLSLAGYFRLQVAAESAWQATHSQANYDLAVAGVNCLLGLDLVDYAGRICKRLDEIEGQSLFAELLPALAASAGWPNGSERLWAWADRVSVDCLGGIVLGLGFYRCGQQLLDLLVDEFYELYGGGTGLERFAYQACRLQGWDIPWLAAQLREKGASLPLWRSWLAWCRLRLAWLVDERPDLPPPASLAEIYSACFAWGDSPNRDGSLASICPLELREQYDAVESCIRQALPFDLLPGALV